MTRRIYILTIMAVLLGLVAFAWAATSHKDFAEMKMKDCAECHQSSGARLNHGEFWIKEHKLAANNQENNCKDCHQQSFCLDCHKGGGIDSSLHVSNSGADYMPSTHRTDFRELHPLKAREDGRSCLRCHDSKRFCTECHSKFKRDDLQVLSHRRGWTDLDLKAGGPNHSLFTTAMCQACHNNSILPKNQWSGEHAREARKNLATCQTCHSDGVVCMKCHSAVSGLKINPHPRNWSKISGRLRSASNNRTCVKCHLN